MLTGNMSVVNPDDSCAHISDSVNYSFTPLVNFISTAALMNINVCCQGSQ